MASATASGGPASVPPAAPTATGASGTGSATGPVKGGDQCGERYYRCAGLDEAVRWWAGKPLLVPASGTAGVRAMLHGPGDDGVRRSDDPERPPNLTYVLPDRLFEAASTRKGGVSTAARGGGVVVRTYYVTEKWLPQMNVVSRPVRVRGRDGILSEFRADDSPSALRDLKWWVPHGEGYVVWLLADDAAHRSERELLDLANGLVEA